MPLDAFVYVILSVVTVCAQPYRVRLYKTNNPLLMRRLTFPGLPKAGDTTLASKLSQGTRDFER
jgi:hypothetical protein